MSKCLITGGQLPATLSPPRSMQTQQTSIPIYHHRRQAPANMHRQLFQRMYIVRIGAGKIIYSDIAYMHAERTLTQQIIDGCTGQPVNGRSIHAASKQLLF